jgi:hypothetical protein
VAQASPSGGARFPRAPPNQTAYPSSAPENTSLLVRFATGEFAVAAHRRFLKKKLDLV